MRPSQNQHSPVPLVCDLAQEAGLANRASSVTVATTLLVGLDRDIDAQDPSSASLGLSTYMLLVLSKGKHLPHHDSMDEMKHVITID
jgi:hypothetical protein